MSSSYRLELNKWLSTLEIKADKVLDIGGAQEKMPKRVKSWDVKEYLIADLPSPHKDSPKPDIVLDLNSFDTGLESIYNTFDMIFCLEVFDYVWNTYYAFEEIYNLLKKDGIAWISFPSVYPLHQPIEDDALRYMKGGIIKLAKASNLTIKEMIPRRPETNKWQEFFYAERMRGARGEDHSITGWIVKFKK